jgi:hypothetical protein
VSATGPHYVRMEKLRFFFIFSSFRSVLKEKKDTLVRRVDSLDR